MCRFLTFRQESCPAGSVQAALEQGAYGKSEMQSARATMQQSADWSVSSGIEPGAASTSERKPASTRFRFNLHAAEFIPASAPRRIETNMHTSFTERSVMAQQTTVPTSTISQCTFLPTGLSTQRLSDGASTNVKTNSEANSRSMQFRLGRTPSHVSSRSCLRRLERKN